MALVAASGECQPPRRHVNQIVSPARRGGGRGGGRGDPAGRAGGAPGRAGGAPVDPDAPPPMPQGGGGAAAIAGPGTYRVKITVGEKVVNTTVVVRADPDAARVR